MKKKYFFKIYSFRLQVPEKVPTSSFFSVVSLNSLTYLLFCLFLLSLIFILFISPGRSSSPKNIFQSEDFYDIITYIKSLSNFVPLKTIKLFINGYLKGYLPLKSLISNILGNLVLFMPFGFFLPALFPVQKNFFIYLATVLSSVLAAESLQIIFSVGRFDIDDIILNTFGSLISFLIFSKSKFLKKYFP